MPEDRENAGITSFKKFKWCDLSCEHASFPEEEHLDGSGTCQTFIALYCKKLKKIVTKNAPCAAIHGTRRPTTKF